ncbi:MAG: type II toxin-antitoxin system VapC family toxin [Bacteroidetes bacterium]|nr:type II toxin-antitoxin system VapC family toxin [Bacteroidota bacterium]
MSRDYLLDTNIFGYLTEANEESPSRSEAVILKNKLDNIPKESRLLCCSISLGEIQYGINTASEKVKPNLQKVLECIKSLPILPIDEKVAESAYSDLRARLFEKYAPKDGKKRKRLEEWIDPTTSKILGIQENDLWIVAVALTFNLTVVSNDKMEALKAVAGAEISFEDWLNH